MSDTCATCIYRQPNTEKFQAHPDNHLDLATCTRYPPAINNREDIPATYLCGEFVAKP